MGLWSGLGEVLKGGAKLIGKVAGVSGDVGQVAGGAANNIRAERFEEDDAKRMRDALALQRSQQAISQNQNRDTLALSTAQAGINQNTSRDAQAMQRAQMGIDAPMARTRQAAYGDALKNVQDVNIDFKPTTGALPKFGVTGGLRPSMFGPTARAAGGELGN